MSVVSLFDSSSRALEIIKVVTRHEWSYLTQLLSNRQADSPSLPIPDVLCSILTELGPVYVKLGQLLSTRPDLLGEDYIKALSRLQADVPAVEWEEIEPQLQHSLAGPLGASFKHFDKTPIAAGSVGQVYKAQLADDTTVAVKVLRPGIDVQVDEDGRLLRKVANLAASTPLGSSYDFVGLTDQVLAALHRELDFRVEAGNTIRLKRIIETSTFVADQTLKVPNVLEELSSQRLLVLEWIEGDQILSDSARQILSDRNINNHKESGINFATKTLLGAFVEQYFVEGFFHADPHPGNIKVNSGGEMTLLDEGMVGMFDPRTRTALLDLVLALINQDGARATDLLVQIAPPGSNVKINRQQLKRQLDQLIASNFSKPLKELNFARFLGDLLQLANQAGLRVPGNLGLFVKSVTNLEGVACSLNPNFSFTHEMEPLIGQLMSSSLILPTRRLMQFGLDLRNLSVDAPRQLSELLRRFSSDELVFSIQIEGLESLRRSIERLSQRISLAILVASLLLSATVMATLADQPFLRAASQALFIAATLFGLWLIQSLLRSGNNNSIR